MSYSDELRTAAADNAKTFESVCERVQELFPDARNLAVDSFTVDVETGKPVTAHVRVDGRWETVLLRRARNFQIPDDGPMDGVYEGTDSPHSDGIRVIGYSGPGKAR